MRTRLAPAAALLIALWAVPLGEVTASEPTDGRATAPAPGPPPIELEPARVALAGIETSVTIRDRGLRTEGQVEIRDSQGAKLADERLGPGSEATVSFRAPHDGRVSVWIPELYEEGATAELRTIPAWLSVVPPLLAIGLALLFRQVLPALFAGIWVGAWMAHGGPLAGAMRALDTYVIGALTDSDRLSIVVFSLLLGGMVGIVSRSGGMVGLVEALRPWATTRRRGQLVTWLLGLLVFFDDYANTLLVGNTMRPVTDRLRVSREKLAYIVDATAAPVASIALVSTWIGYEVSLIGDALSDVGSDAEAYGVFLRSLAYNFYPMFALVLGLMIAGSRRDFGPMLRAERRAYTGKVLADTAVPLADFDREGLSPSPGKPRRWLNAAIPVVVVLVVTFASLWLTGRSALVERGAPAGTESLFRLGVEGLGSVFGAGESYKALLWGSASGCLVAIVLAATQGLLGIGEALGAWIGGIKSMMMAMIILTLAWSISDVCGALNTSGFLVSVVSDVLDPRFLPAIVFTLAAITAFATGTSWTTMGILIPLAVPTAYGVAAAAGSDPIELQRVLLASVSAVLAGAIFGDHCSPISDTTILSSMATGCDHLDHVRTQLPYALAGGVVALGFGYLPAGFGVHPALCLVGGIASLAALVRLAGRRSAGR